MQGIGSFALSEGGSDAVRKRWLPAVAAFDAIAALALTEPDVGSDLKAITTTVTATGGQLVVSGHKSFITNAGDADLYTVLCREGDDQFSLVLVPTAIFVRLADGGPGGRRPPGRPAGRSARRPGSPAAVNAASR